MAWHHALGISKSIGYSTAPPDWLFLLGAAGVDVFFVISGFIMVYICARRGDVGSVGSSGRFLINRVKRIYPLYWIFCSLFLLAILLGFFSEKVLNGYEIIGSLLLWYTNPRIHAISWTLTYEMFFYLIFSLCLFLPSVKKAAFAAMVAIIFTVAVGIFAFEDQPFITSPIMLEFVLGMLVGLAYIRGWLRSAWLGNPMVAVIAIAALCVNGAAFYVGTTHRLPHDVRFYAWGLPSVLLLLFALNYRMSDGIGSRLAVATGDASYATYLFHVLVLIVYAKAFELIPQLTVLSQWIWVPLATLGCLVAGWVMHVVIERPIIKALRKRPAS